MNVKFQLKSAGYCMAKKSHALRGGANKDIRFYATYGVIHHPTHGVILFDVGYSQRFFDYTNRFPYKLYQYMTKVFITAEEEVVTALRNDGINPEAVNYIIISHFHADHIGGLKDFPNATFICSKTAYETVKGKSGWAAMRHGFVPHFMPDDFESRLRLIEIEKGTIRDNDLGKLVDVFDDGSILLCDLNGHAVGQIGAILNTENQPTFLVADACWLEETYKEGWLPSPIVRLFFGDWKAFKSNVKAIEHYHNNNPETVVIPCHCESTMWRVIKKV